MIQNSSISSYKLSELSFIDLMELIDKGERFTLVEDDEECEVGDSDERRSL